jgi:hypothetical protein
MIRHCAVGVLLVLGSACTAKAPVQPGPSAAAAQATQERQNDTGSLVSPESQTTILAAASGKLQLAGKAHIGALYYLDRPAHRLAVLTWFAAHNAQVRFESQTYGFVDALIDWKDLAALIETSGNLGLDQASLMKLELDSVALNPVPGASPAPVADTGPRSPDAPDSNSSFFGPVHSAGYGARVDEFRANAAKDLGMKVEDLAGQGSLIAIFDGGVDLSRTDVYQNRVVDIVVGEDGNWMVADKAAPDYLKATKLAALPAGLEDLKDEPSLRFVALDEKALQYDLNGDGNQTDTLWVAVYQRKGSEPEARFQAAAGLPFGPPLTDFGSAHRAGKPTLVDLSSGGYYVRASQDREASRGSGAPADDAVGVKLRSNADGTLSIAFAGTAIQGMHGISNLHMAGGNYTDPQSKVHYDGAAPGVGFLIADTWLLDASDYGERWLPLARTIIQSADAKADVIDLDIATPGAPASGDLLSHLLCRVTAATASVPVVAAHNYGPIPETVQSLAQSPCVIGIGASHSVAAMKQGRNQGSIEPALAALGDDAVMTASYSGRGFGLNGLYKPDVISPAYGYTAYGAQFTRFGGTSGATPTTAGMIALLKQAARAKGLELGLEQVRFLLQSSSNPVRDGLLRDGYGYTDLAAAWELLKKNPGLAAFALTPKGNFQFDGRPTQDILGVPLDRRAVFGGTGSPEKMKFWIEYGVSSESWLKFEDPSLGQATTTLSKDAPMVGEQQALRLHLDLPDAVWNALPPGDHVAIVKGVRESLSADSNRPVDFLLPVSFFKPVSIDETTFDLGTLYADQYASFVVATEPGDRLYVTGESRCLGATIAGAVAGTDSDGLKLAVREQEAYPEAALVMNSYAPLTLTTSPVRVISRRNLVQLAVTRYGQLDCDGPMGGTLHVRRAGFALGTAETQLLDQQGKLAVSVSVQLRTTGAGLVPSDQPLNTAWAISTGTPALTLRGHFKGATSFTIPAGTRAVVVHPDDATKFQALLAEIEPDGVTIDSQSTTRYEDDAIGGLGSVQMFFEGDWAGLKLTAPKAGNTARFEPAVDSDGNAATGATIELRVDAPFASVTLASSGDPLTSWPASSPQKVQLQATLPDSTPDVLKDFTSDAWSAALVLPIAVQETMPNGVPDASYVPVELWRSAVTVPITLK